MFSSSGLYLEDIYYIANFNIDWQRLCSSSILITGATGLIGTVLVDALMYKNENDGLDTKVFALSRDKDRAQNHFRQYRDNDLFYIVQGDVIKDIIIDENIDFIINLAGNTHPMLYATEPIKTIDSIVSGTRNILEFAATHKTKRVINASSVEIYGENRGDTEKFTEDYCGYINCNTLRAGYSEAKRLAESLCQAYIYEKGLNIVSARLGRVYGAPTLSSDTKATTQFIRSTVNGDDIVMKSEGKQKYSYVYVADAVTALLLLLVNGESGEAYNISDDEVISFRETAELLASLNNRKVIFNIPSETESKGFSVVLKALMDSSKIRKLGWRSKYNLKMGLRRTVYILRAINDEKTQ